jgi:hypothetical protein
MVKSSKFNVQDLIFLAAIILSLILFQGCLRTYYPAVYQTSATPIIFNNSGEDKLRRFATADYSTNRGLYEDELLQILRFGYLMTDTRDYFNFNFGLTGYTGNYHVSGVSPKYDGNKNFIGLGGNLRFVLNFKIENFKMGIGTDAGVGIEFGEYYNFRKSAGDENLISSSDKLNPLSLHLSVFPVMNYSFSETTNMSFQMNLGIPGFISPGAVLNSDGYVFWMSWFPNKDSRSTLYSERIVFGFMMNLNKLSL